MNTDNLRVSKLRDYLFDVIDGIVEDKRFKINVDMLSKDINNYSLDKVPVESEVETWITGLEIHRDIFIFRSRMAYSQDIINNLKNVGFFEIFESIIKENNENKILPKIDGIEEIKCLNCGTMRDANTNTCEFQIQLEIRYTVGGEICESLQNVISI